MLQRNEYFCAFSVGMLWGKCDSSFSPTTTNIERQILRNIVKYCPIWRKFSVFSYFFFFFFFFEASNCEEW